jgi:PTH1 family peptidyl-tRNA hydrolase
MKLIVGLGNPGPQYAKTRHNVGFNLIERFAALHGLSARKMLFNAMTISGQYGAERVILARPLTYMNDSGKAVGSLWRWLKLGLEDLLVVYDEIDLPVGKLRLRPGGGSAGHHGMKSIITHIGSDQFARLRIGVGRPVHGDGVNFVLSDFTRDELPVVGEAFDRGVQAVETFVESGIGVAMNKFNADLPS